MNKKLILVVALIMATGFVIGIKYGCVFQNVFGIICPSCGVSRAWLSLIRGDILKAYSIHPMFYAVPLVMIYCCLKKPIVSMKFDWMIIGILMMAYITFWLFRIN